MSVESESVARWNTLLLFLVFLLVAFCVAFSTFSFMSSVWTG